MRAIIICSGIIKDYDYIKTKIKQDDYIICADGGYNHAVMMNIKPDILLGDMDSISEQPNDIQMIIYPIKKDLTDSEISVRYALDKGFDEIILIASTGTRLDHTLTNIFLLKQILDNHKKGSIIDDDNEIYMVNDNISIDGEKGDTISIIPVYGNAVVMTTEGLEYEASNTNLYFGKSLGNSNCMESCKCSITIKDGIALVIKSKD